MQDSSTVVSYIPRGQIQLQRKSRERFAKSKVILSSVQLTSKKEVFASTRCELKNEDKGVASFVSLIKTAEEVGRISRLAWTIQLIHQDVAEMTLILMLYWRILPNQLSRLRWYCTANFRG